MPDFHYHLLFCVRGIQTTLCCLAHMDPHETAPSASACRPSFYRPQTLMPGLVRGADKMCPEGALLPQTQPDKGLNAFLAQAELLLQGTFWAPLSSSEINS